MTDRVSVEKLRTLLDAALANNGELALLDVRESGQYSAGHLFFATHLPYSQLELEVGNFVPRKTVSIVVYDANDGVSEKAFSALVRLGYTEVSILDGGALAWAEAGHTLYEGVNLPSKTFGELIEHELKTPYLSAEELVEMKCREENLIILDGRTPEEFKRFNIPGGISCPNAELALRFDDVVPNTETTVVINCAGRTRSIIGAQTLINFGIKNKIYALENGTQGWALADRDLEYGANRHPPKNSNSSTLNRARKRAQLVSKNFSVSFVDMETLVEWKADDRRTLFLLDVRSHEEYLAGHLRGSLHAAGGQLVQATDRWVGVRGARLVVCDDTEVRAICTAHWLKQMGWDVYVLRGGIGDSDLLKDGLPQPKFQLPKISATNLIKLMADEIVSLLDLRTSNEFQEGHIDGAQWAIRPILDALVIPAHREVILICDDPGMAWLVAGDLGKRSLSPPRILDGGMLAWREAGGETVVSDQGLAPSERIDFVAFTAERHGGNKDHMRQYLDWEINLISQLDDQERGAFKIVHP